MKRGALYTQIKCNGPELVKYVSLISSGAIEVKSGKMLTHQKAGLEPTNAFTPE